MFLKEQWTLLLLLYNIKMEDHIGWLAQWFSAFPHILSRNTEACLPKLVTFYYTLYGTKNRSYVPLVGQERQATPGPKASGSPILLCRQPTCDYKYN